MSSPSGLPRTVALPMYLTHRDAEEALWASLRRYLAASGLADLPEKLQWPVDLQSHWLDPALLMSQACGYPLVTFLSGKVRVIGTFRYTAEGCDGHFCRSALVVRKDNPANSLADLRGQVLAFNSADSQSGYNSLRAMVAALPQNKHFFSSALRTDSHRQSLEQVNRGVCEVAALDCVTLAGLRQSQPELCDNIRVMGWTDPYPGLPLITSNQTSNETLALLRQALTQAMEDPELRQTREALLISSFVPLQADDYAVCADMRQTALRRGCTEL